MITASSDEEAQLLVWHIERAKAAHDRRTQVGLGLLARNGRPLDAWCAELRVLTAAQGYRSPAASPGELAAIAEDPRVPPDQRIGAVFSLAALPPDAPERMRVRLAIETTAHPALRVVLEQAVEGQIDEAALAAAVTGGNDG